MIGFPTHTREIHGGIPANLTSRITSAAGLYAILDEYKATLRAVRTSVPCPYCERPMVRPAPPARLFRIVHYDERTGLSQQQDPPAGIVVLMCGTCDQHFSTPEDRL